MPSARNLADFDGAPGQRVRATRLAPPGRPGRPPQGCPAHFRAPASFGGGGGLEELGEGVLRRLSSYRRHDGLSRFRALFLLGAPCANTCALPVDNVERHR